MKQVFTILLLLILTFSARSQLIPELGSQRAGTSSLQFLKIGVGARSTAMGEAFVSVADDITALYWNPAGLVQFEGNGIHLSHSEWLVDLRHEFFGGVYRFGSNNALGLSITALHTPAMKRTTEFQPQGNGEYFKFGDLAFGLTYARKMTDQFSFGVTFRYVEETLAELKMRAYLFDLGTFYWTGLGTTRFAVSISNFGPQVHPTGSVKLINGNTLSDFQNYPPPTIFRIGFAMDPISTESNKLTTSIQLNHPNDNAENFNIGAEYAYKNMFFLRGGYKLNVDTENFTAGVGFKMPVYLTRIAADYSIANFKELGLAHRISLNVLLNK